MSSSRFGIDFAWHNPITDAIARDLRDKHGVTFVARYLHDKNDSKQLTKAEATIWSRNGIDIVTVWETTATRAEDGYAAGKSDAQRALANARAAGQPDSEPIFFAVDEDTTVGPHITAYWNGILSVLPVHRSGAYGGLRIIQGLFAAKLIAYGWQTYAWSHGAWDARAQLRQYSNGHTLDGISCDYDTAVALDFGQWRIGAAPSPKPSPVVHHGPRPPKDVEGNWPYGAADYMATKRADAHCHSGYYSKDRPHVAAWERQMRLRGWSIHVDGLYGPEDEAICKAFQHEKHLAVDGKVGHSTWDHARHDPVT